MANPTQDLFKRMKQFKPKTMKTKFVIFCNQMIGEIKPANDIQECLNNMAKRHEQFWSNIMWRDNEGRTINFHREFFEDQGMSIEAVIDDWIWNTSSDEQEQPIYALKGTEVIEL